MRLFGSMVGATLFALTFSISPVSAAKPSRPCPVPVIIETDMGNDVDDALAFDLMFKAQDEGLMKILAIGNHKKSDTATDYIDILCTFFGYPDIPIAKSSTPVTNDSAKDYTETVCNMKNGAGQLLYKRSKKPSDIKDPVKLFRQKLAKAKDHSVVFISLGFGTDLAALMASPADKYSNLDGMELIARKVKFLSIMAGSYGPRKINEFNVINDIPAMKAVLERWPSPIVQNPFELGKMVKYPGKSIMDDFMWTAHHPVADAYECYKKMPYDRPSWDILSAVYVIHPDMFTIGPAGEITVNDEGMTTFVEKSNGKSATLSADKSQSEALLDYIVTEITKQPKRLSCRP
jgi:inosine-uridine nucleoside N-ribohydrolase